MIALRKGTQYYLSFSIFLSVCFLLYLSYYFEAGLFHTYGGDDESYYLMIKDTFYGSRYSYSFENFVNGRFSSYIYSLTFITYPFRLLGIEIDYPVTLSMFHAALGSLLFPIYTAIYRKLFNAKGYAWSVLFFTPLVYYSIVNREVLNFLAFALAIYIMLFSKNNVIKMLWIVFLFSFMYFVRPETSFAVLLLYVLNYLRSIRGIIYIGIGVILIIYIFSYFTTAYVKTLAVGQEIYFANAETNNSGIGYQLRFSNNILLKTLNYVYTFFSPIPPYYIHTKNTEFLYLSIGQTLWYVVIMTYIYYYRWLRYYLQRNLPIVSVFIIVFIYVAIVAYFGGTTRHYYSFLPVILLPFDYLREKFPILIKSILARLMIFFPVIIVIYLVLRLIVN